MAEYMRKIIYLRKKEGGTEFSGSGYIRLERKGNELRIHLTIPEKNRFGELPVYAIYEKNKELQPLLLGKMDGKSEWEYIQPIDTKKMEWYAEDILGFLIGHKDYYLAGESPDYRGKISYENIVFRKSEPEKTHPVENGPEKKELEENEPELQKTAPITKAAEEHTEEKAKDNLGQPTDKRDEITREEEETRQQVPAHPEHEMSEKQEVPLKAASENEDSFYRKPFVSQNLFERLTEMYPFEDDEMEWCFGMEPKDLSYFPMEYWHYAKNTFLLQGFYNYRHLLYAHKEGKNYLGVPGQFHRREQFLAGQFGFPLFKATKKKRTTVGDFGYWMKELE